MLSQKKETEGYVIEELVRLMPVIEASFRDEVKSRNQEFIDFKDWLKGTGLDKSFKLNCELYEEMLKDEGYLIEFFKNFPLVLFRTDLNFIRSAFWAEGKFDLNRQIDSVVEKSMQSGSGYGPKATISTILEPILMNLICNGAIRLDSNFHADVDHVTGKMKEIAKSLKFEWFGSSCFFNRRKARHKLVNTLAIKFLKFVILEKIPTAIDSELFHEVISAKSAALDKFRKPIPLDWVLSMKTNQQPAVSRRSLFEWC